MSAAAKFASVVVFALLALWPAAALGQSPARPAAMEAWAEGRIAEILAQGDMAEGGPDLAAMHRELSAVFDALIAYGDERRAEAWVEAAKWRRLSAFFKDAPRQRQGPAWGVLRANPTFAGHLAFALHEDDDANGMSRLIVRLAGDHGEAGRLETFGALAAAVCVVFEEPLHYDINENRVNSPDPVALFGYFVENERALVFNPRNMPPDVLIYLVDVTGTIDELKWALRKHRGDRRIGARYFDIKYDYEHFRRGAEKQVTREGFTLANIEKYGGVCADQAYYAMTCGKAIGVPTTYVVARSAEVSHAWVGFVEGRGSRAEWNLEFGRYDAYKGVKGDVFDPQRRERISDGDLAFLAESMTEPREQRWAAAALTDAGIRLLELEGSAEEYPPPYPLAVKTSRDLPRTRPPTLADALGLVETGLRRTPGYRRGWEVIRDIAADGRLSYEQKQNWAKVLDRLAGSKYPDFTLSVLRPMIETVEETRAQHELWERALRICSGRSDLIAEIRMAQGRLWEREGDKNKAWACYQEVIQRYTNDGPFVIDALKSAERLLRVSGKNNQIGDLYEDAWERVRPPQQMAEQFMRQSNYFRIGLRYADLLDRSGRTNVASRVRGKIGLIR